MAALNGSFTCTSRSYADTSANHHDPKKLAMEACNKPHRATFCFCTGLEFDRKLVMSPAVQQEQTEDCTLECTRLASVHRWNMCLHSTMEHSQGSKSPI